MNSLKVRINGNGPEANAGSLSAAPAYPLLASCYYHFGYLRLAREAAARK